jgi:general secretion pathway protein D
MTRRLRLAVAAAALALLAGCAAQRYNTEGMKLVASGQREQGLALLAQASQLEPTNSRYRLDYLTQQALAVRELLARADDARAAGRTADARELYLATLRLDAGSDRARLGLKAVDMDERHAALVADAGKLAKAGDLAGARAKLRLVLLENPANAGAQRELARVNGEVERAEEARRAQIAAASVLKKPVTLQFRDANLRMVFEALSRTTGLNVIFDRDVRPDLKTTIFVRDASVGDTVDLILLQNQLEKKVLNANTMLIYPATGAKQKEYQDLKVRTFQISNADAKHLQNVLKSVLKVKDIALDERSNTLVIRDTPDTVAVAERIIAAHDFADPEVMLEVEVLEVSRDRLSNLGIKWPDSATISTPTNASGGLTIGELRGLTRDQLLITPLSVGLNLKLQDTDANLLASPRIRARHREKARILIGDKVPVITNTATPLGTGGSVVTGSVQYLDVGIKLEVEPHVYVEGDVGIKLNLEVSNIVREIAGPQGSLAYQIGTRNATTNLRLRDGETQILGGLISDQDRNTASKVPGIGQLPILGRLFSSDNGTHTKSEIVLSITPRIVRNAATADANLRDVYSGTEAAVRETPLRLDPVGSVSGSAGSVPFVAPGGQRAAPTAPDATDPAAPRAPASPQGVASPAPAAAPAPAPGGSATGAVVGSPGGDATGTTPGAPPATTPRPPTLTPVVPAPRTPVPAESLPPSIRPGGIYKPAPPPQPAAPKPSPGPPPPDETVDNGAAPAVAAASALPATRSADAGPLELAWQGPYRVKVGQPFEVALEVNASADLTRLPLVVRFDPLVLTFLDAQLAEFASKSGVGALKPEVDVGRGSVRFDLQAGAGKSFRGQGVLLNLRFAARAPRQQTQLTLAQIELKDESGVLAAAVRPTPLTLRVGS